MNTINILSESLANKIAAGEVVERPASVVKELVENSLDAGADRISVEIEDGGKKLIRVVDNGSGMTQDDANVCYKRFATSKIRTASDLANIATLGFRGEALPSISEVSFFSLTTKPADQTVGTRVVISGGKIIEQTQHAAANGTGIEVKNLFFNVPARKKFLKSTTSEAAAISTLMTTMALNRPDVTFLLKHNSRQILFAQSTTDPAQRIHALFGAEVAQNLIKTEYELNGLKATGFAVHPHFTRQNRTWQYFFVNSRPITNQTLSFAVKQAYHSLVFRDRFPVCFLWLEIPLDAVDVNVHPTKKEVKFSDEQMVRRLVSRAVKQALESKELLNPVPLQNNELNQPQAIYAPSPSSQKTVSSPRAAFRTTNTYIPAQQPAPQTGFEGQTQQQMFDSPHTHTDTASHGGLGVNLIGQYDRTYILAQKGSRLFIFDQHAAHERIYYERLLDQARKNSPVSQRLLTPAILDLGPGEFAALYENLETLNSFGLELIAYGDSSFSIESVPAILNFADPIPFVNDLADRLKAQSKIEYQQIDKIADKIARAACRSAIKANDSLTRKEMEKLISDLEKCKTPHCCPHGRPVFIEITTSELEKRFKRTI